MKNLINIILMTFRSSHQARTNILIAIEATNQYENVRLSIGYGGIDHLHIDWLNRNLPKTGRVKLLIDQSPQDRFLWALQQNSEWVIFISDDDAITSNYFSALVDEIHHSDLSISNIFPKYYALNNGSATEIINLPNLEQEDPILRFVQYATQINAGIRYYSAHRAGKIKELVREKINSNFFPSYIDQLIVASSLIEGKSITCSGTNIFVYDLENWKDLKHSIASDAKSYREKSMVFFHEIYWIIDYIKIFHVFLDRTDFFEWFKSYAIQRIEYSLTIFETRRNVISFTNEESQFFSDKIILKYNAIKKTSSKEELFSAIAA